MEEILKNDALVTKKKRKKVETFVRQCWYIQTSWILCLFQLTFLHVIKQEKISALSEKNSKKVKYSPLYDHHIYHHKNSYYNHCHFVSCFFCTYNRWHSASATAITLTQTILWKSSCFCDVTFRFVIKNHP